MNTIGPSFSKELLAAGVAGLPFTWKEDGVIFYGETVTEAQKSQVEAVLAAHDPSTPPPKSKRALAKEKLVARDPASIADPVLREVVEFLQV